MMMTRAQVVAAVAILVAALAVSARAQGPWDAPGRCGPNAPTPVCSGCRCCSRWDYCGNTALHCGSGCQSQCGCGSGNGTSVASIVTPAVFEELLPYRNDLSCPARGFYTYDAFIAAAADNSEAGFGTTGDVDTRKREIAAFLAEPAHRTSGGWDGAPGGAYAWGLCFKPAGVNATDPVIFFETGIEAWMTAQPPTKPSCHDVVTGEWSPSDADVAAGRLPGFGVIANIINGPAECGHGFNQGGNDRIGFYKRFCDILGVSYGDNLDCYNQKPFDTTTGVAAALDETTTAAPRHADA